MLSRLLVGRILPHLCVDPAREEGVRKWLVAGSYRPEDSTSGKGLRLKQVTLSEYLPYLCFDYQRFALSAWESFDSACTVAPEIVQLSWPLLKLYYASFFSAHALIRAEGISLLRLDRSHCSLMNMIADQYGCQTKISTGTYYAKTIQETDGTISVHIEPVVDTGGAHDAFWGVFDSYLRDVEASFSKNQSSDLSAIGQLSDLQQILRADGSAHGNWLSTMRNRINYQHLYEVWRPLKKSHYAKEAISRLKVMQASAIRLDLNIQKQPLSAFAGATHCLSALCFEVSSELSRRNAKAQSFGGKWRRLTQTT